MKLLLRSEEAVLFAATLVFYQNTGYSWTSFIVFFLAPDLSMLGYGLKFPESFQKTHLGAIGPISRKSPGI